MKCKSLGNVPVLIRYLAFKFHISNLQFTMDSLRCWRLRSPLDNTKRCLPPLHHGMHICQLSTSNKLRVVSLHSCNGCKCKCCKRVCTPEQVCLSSLTHHMCKFWYEQCKWKHFHPSPGVKPLHTSHSKRHHTPVHLPTSFQPAIGHRIQTQQLPIFLQWFGSQICNPKPQDIQFHICWETIGFIYNFGSMGFFVYFKVSFQN